MHVILFVLFILCISLQNVLKKEKWKIDNFFQDGISCCLPLDPAVRVKALDVDVRMLHSTLHLLNHYCNLYAQICIPFRKSVYFFDMLLTGL